MKQNLRVLMLFLMAMLFLGGASFAQEAVTYTVASTSSVTASKEIEGVTATFKNTYTSNKEQLTAGKTMTLTIKGYPYQVAQLKLNLHRNSSKGDGTLIMKAGETTLIDKTLSKDELTSSYALYTYDANNYTANKQDLVITLTGKTNSIYCNSFTIIPVVDSSKKSTTLTFCEGNDNKTFNLTVGADFSAPTATLTPAEAGSISYSSSNEEVAKVDAATGAVTLGETAGTAVITATFAGNDTYNSSSASYTIKLTKPFAVEDGVFDFTGTYDYGTGLTPSTDTKYVTSSTWTAGNVVLTTSEGTGIRWWVTKDGNELRVYKNTNLTISVPEGNVISSVTLDGVANGVEANCGSFNSGKWTGAAQSVTFTVSATKNIDKITVKYAKAESLTTAASGFATYAADYCVNYSELGLKAYLVTLDSDAKTVKYTEFTSVVPAGKAVLVKGEPNKSYELTPASDDAATSNFVTDLLASDGNVTSDGALYYAFGTLNGESGFKLVADGVQIPAKKGYLKLAEASTQKFFSFNGNGSTTGINQIEGEASSANAAIYNLAGQRVNKTFKGVVIKNGKKYIIK